jgi:hypothetical protein
MRTDANVRARTSPVEAFGTSSPVTMCSLFFVLSFVTFYFELSKNINKIDYSFLLSEFKSKDVKGVQGISCVQFLMCEQSSVYKSRKNHVFKAAEQCGI